jgi:hypothetical protein
MIRSYLLAFVCCVALAFAPARVLGDIEAKIWFVDGIARTDDYVIPAGSHQISLRVIDARGNR